MRYMLFVKGDGRGHLTQSLSLCQLLMARGHEVAAIVLGAPAEANIPAFIFEKAPAPVIRLHSPVFALNKTADRIDFLKTGWEGVRNLGRQRTALQEMGRLLQQHKPDCIISLYEPLVALYSLFGKHKLPPVVNISHQNLMLHPAFEFPPARAAEKAMVRNYTSLLVPKGSKTLSLSFYDFPDHEPTRNYSVPPLLRQEVFERTPTDAGHILVYMVYPGIRRMVEDFNRQHPHIRIHAFYNQKDAPAEQQVTDTLTFHTIHDTKFLDYLASARGVATTAGFETVCEAFFYRKPAILMPMPSQYEQFVNAWDAQKVGAGKLVDELNPQVLTDFIPQYAPQHEAYLHWMRIGADKLTWHLEHPATSGTEYRPSTESVGASHPQQSV